MRISDWSSDVCSSDLFGAFSPGEFARSRRARIEWVPRTLFGAADLPSVDINVPTHGGNPFVRSEDIVLGLAAAAPGNATRRWGMSEVHWRAPKLGRAPYLSEIGRAHV